MGNCETCQNVNQTAGVNLTPYPETPAPFSFDELAQICPEPVKNTYMKLG